ncbi:MAG TPA: hypothetical protein VF039_06920 [Longimicrobiales bacterium]
MHDTRALIGHPRYAASCVLRAAIVWIAIRAATLLAKEPVEGARVALTITAIVCAVALIDARATRELVWMRNLGLPARWLAAVTAATALLLELLFHAIA